MGRSAVPREIHGGECIPRRIFVLWTGDNVLSERRASNLDAIRRAHPGIDVVLVTPGTLQQWLVPDLALPPQYEFLSLVHRSDVLRCYLLHVHGGGYSDVKQPQQSWHGAFEKLEASDAWLLGYTERHRLNVPLVGGQLRRDLRAASRQLLGYGGLIARARTPLTQEWWDRVCEVLDENDQQLRSHPGNVRGDNPGYPLGWTEVLAHIAAPLTWKHQDHVLHDARVLPVLRKYL